MSEKRKRKAMSDKRKRKAMSSGEEDSITKLDLSFSMSNRPVRLLENFSRYKSLESVEELELEYDDNFDIPSNGCFPSLKILDVCARHPEYYEFLSRLFRSCPVLEDLSLHGNFEQGDHDAEHTLTISIPTLKRLNIEFFLDELQRCSDHKIIIQTPKLEYLTILDYSLVYFEIGKIPSLVEADVSIGNTRYFNINGDVSKDQTLPDRMEGILEGIRYAKILTLYENTTAALSCVYDDNLPTFPFLVRLKLGIDHFFEWKLLPYFLRNSKLLEFLVLERESEAIWIEEVGASELDPDICFGWMPPKFSPYLSPHLKEIQMRNLWGSKDEMEVIKYLLKNGKALEKMSIKFEENARHKELEKDLDKDMIERFPRGSSKCKLEFV